MSPADAKTAIFNATVELLRLNQKVGNALPKEIVQCIDGEPRVSSDKEILAYTSSMYSGSIPAGRTTVTTETASGVAPTSVTITEGTSTAPSTRQNGGRRRSGGKPVTRRSRSGGKPVTRRSRKAYLKLFRLAWRSKDTE